MIDLYCTAIVLSAARLLHSIGHAENEFLWLHTSPVVPETILWEAVKVNWQHNIMHVDHRAAFCTHTLGTILSQFLGRDGAMTGKTDSLLFSAWTLRTRLSREIKGLWRKTSGFKPIAITKLSLIVVTLGMEHIIGSENTVRRIVLKYQCLNVDSLGIPVINHYVQANSYTLLHHAPAAQTWPERHLRCRGDPQTCSWKPPSTATCLHSCTTVMVDITLVTTELTNWMSLVINATA